MKRGVPILKNPWTLWVLLALGMAANFSYQMMTGGLNKPATENAYKVSIERARMLFLN